MKNYIIDLLKSSVKGLAFGVGIFLGLLTVFAVTWPSITPSGEITGGAFMNYFNKMLVNTGSTTDGTVKKSESLGLNGTSAVITISGGLASTSGVPVGNNDIANKAYVDSVVAAGAGLGVYKGDGITYLGKFVQLKNAYESDSYSDVEQIVYVDSSGNIQRISSRDRIGASDWGEYYKDSNCTGTRFVYYNNNNGVVTYSTVRAKSDGQYYKYTVGPSCSLGSSGPIYRWNFTNSTCVLVSSSTNYCAYNTATYVPKLCGQGDCKIK